MIKMIFKDKDLTTLGEENNLLIKLIYLIENGVPIERELLEEYAKKIKQKRFDFMSLDNPKNKSKIINYLFRNPEMQFVARLIINYSNWHSRFFIKIIDLLRSYQFEKAKTRIIYENYVKKVKTKIILTAIIIYISGIFSLIYLFPLFKGLLISSYKLTDFLSIILFLSLAFTINIILNTYIIFESLGIKRQEFILFLILILGLFMISLIKIFL